MSLCLYLDAFAPMQDAATPPPVLCRLSPIPFLRYFSPAPAVVHSERFVCPVLLKTSERSIND